MAELPPAAVRLLLRLPGAFLGRLAGPAAPVDGRTLDPAFRLLARASAGRPHLAELPPQAARRATDAAFRALSGRSRKMAAIDDLAVPGPGGAIPARLYRPRGLPARAPLALFFHQGGFVIGSVASLEPFCTRLADTARCLVLSVGYRLAPEHPFPAATADALASFAWAAERADALGADPRRLVVAGDSAGGNLATVIAQETRRGGGPRPAQQLLVYPWLVAEEQTPSRRTMAGAWPLDRRLLDWFTGLVFERPEQRDDPRANPLVAPDLEGLAPALVFTAGFDPLRDEGRLYAERLEAAGVPVLHRCFDALPHSFLGMGAVPAAARAQREIAGALRRALGGG